MKKSFAVIAILIASFATFSASALSKPKATRPNPQPIQTGPRQFIQSSALSSGVSVTITVVSDWSEESNIQSSISNVLSDLSRIDAEINGAAEGELSKINALSKGQEITLSNEFFDLISKARELADLTQGWFDITISSSGGWFSAKTYRQIKLDAEKKTFAFKTNDMQIDISAIWPAYLADITIGKLANQGITNAKVEVGNVNRNIGQDIYTPWNVSVAIPNPNSANAYRSYVYSFSNKAVATLTPDMLLNPIIDRRNNEPVSNTFKNVTVFGGDSMTASAFAVALYTLGPKDAPAFADRHPEVKGIFIDAEGKRSSSRDLVLTHPNYANEEMPTAPTVDRGPNDLKRKQLEESKD